MATVTRIMKSLGLGLLLVTSACGKIEVGDPQFEPYVQTFKSLAAEHGHALGATSVQFGDAQGNAAICVRNFLVSNEVVVERAIWDNLNSDYREALLFHELGHCLLDRRHEDGTFQKNLFGFDEAIPRSLMNTIVPDTQLYRELRPYYIEELFTGASIEEALAAAEAKATAE